MTKLVYVVGGDSSVEYIFAARGWDVIADRGYSSIHSRAAEADLLCFTGGSDINPELYGEPNRGSYISEFSKRRDAFEVDVYKKFAHLPKVGICRGGQLFNIMNGGKMKQHIEGHTGRDHKVLDQVTGKTYLINSCHHQEMVPTVDATQIAFAHDGTVEALFYEGNADLCFQAHPEWAEGTENYFFELFDRYVADRI